MHIVFTHVLVMHMMGYIDGLMWHIKTQWHMWYIFEWKGTHQTLAMFDSYLE